MKTEYTIENKIDTGDIGKQKRDNNRNQERQEKEFRERENNKK